MTSILFCKHGGFIYPITSGQTSQVGILHLIYVAEEGAVTSGKSNDGGPAAGELINYKFTTYEPRWKFGEVTPNYYILYHKNSYVDDNGSIRIRKTEGIESKSDYYCVAMSTGFITAADELCTPEPQYNRNFGFKLQIQLEDSKGSEYNMDVIIADAKSSSDAYDFHAHSNLIEFLLL
ncbi:MAG: hypothetical protein K2L82_13285 [Lachnospiraceae bacterium]|nr:hypothetical protein [Lachnospiraceae bacterium]